MSKKRIYYIIFFTLLVLGFFGALAVFVPGYFNQKFPPIGVVGSFSFLNQDGKTVTDRDVLGKVNVVNFFFTTCKSVCPKMNDNLRPVYEAFKDDTNFLMLSYTCDPKRDSVQSLRHYADSMKVDTRKWIFLTGKKDSLYAMARHSYRIDNPKNFVPDPESDFLHTQFIALVNKKGEVISIYDGIKPSEVLSMQTDIKKLLKE